MIVDARSNMTNVQKAPESLEQLDEFWLYLAEGPAYERVIDAKHPAQPNARCLVGCEIILGGDPKGDLDAQDGRPLGRLSECSLGTARAVHPADHHRVINAMPGDLVGQVIQKGLLGDDRSEKFVAMST